MERCIYCGTETVLHVLGKPICLDCDAKKKLAIEKVIGPKKENGATPGNPNNHHHAGSNGRV